VGHRREKKNAEVQSSDASIVGRNLFSARMAPARDVQIYCGDSRCYFVVRDQLNWVRQRHTVPDTWQCSVRIVAAKILG